MDAQAYFFLGAFITMFICSGLHFWQLRRRDVIHDEYNAKIQAIYEEEIKRLEKIIDDYENDPPEQR